MTPDEMTQRAPFPVILRDLLLQLVYKQGRWAFYLSDLDRGQGSVGLTLVININEPDAYHPERMISVNHLFPVPPAAYDMRSWRRWLFDRIGDVDDHERMEGFAFTEVVDADGATVTTRPYAPSHGPGNDPYMVREVVHSDVDARTSFRGELKP